MNTDTINAADTSSSDQVIGQAIIGLATWTVMGVVSTYLVGISTLMGMIIALAVSLIAALRGTDEAVGRKARGFFAGFARPTAK